MSGSPHHRPATAWRSRRRRRGQSRFLHHLHYRPPKEGVVTRTVDPWWAQPTLPAVPHPSRRRPRAGHSCRMAESHPSHGAPSHVCVYYYYGSLRPRSNAPPGEDLLKDRTNKFYRCSHTIPMITQVAKLYQKSRSSLSFFFQFSLGRVMSGIVKRSLAMAP